MPAWGYGSIKDHNGADGLKLADHRLHQSQSMSITAAGLRRPACRGWLRLAIKAAINAAINAAIRATFVCTCAYGLAACATPATQPAPARADPPRAEVRGTWLTTTANSAIATPADTARTMQRLREIGLNTVYVEAWKNGYTQFPSAVLERSLGVQQRPMQALQDPGDQPAAAPARDLLQETLIEAHRQGLHYIAWFEYGFMAAHGSTMNHLRRLKPHWLSRDIHGREVAPNGFVWLNPLHPEARRFLLDLTLEAIERYDLDGVQFDDRIVWPYVSMGFVELTRQAYAAEHGGRQPPADARDPAWMRWRADKLNALAQDFVRELKAARPGLLVSLSPAPYPWSFEHYLLEWPRWSRWPQAARWDEYVPQAYRMNYAAFEATWREQTQALVDAGGYRAHELVAGIRIVGDGAPSLWPQLRDSMALVQRLQQGGHVLWFSRGVLDLYAAELTQWYADAGAAASPRFPAGWRRVSVALQRGAALEGWQLPPMAAPAPGRYRVIGHDGRQWQYLQDVALPDAAGLRLQAWADMQALELVVDRRSAAQ